MRTQKQAEKLYRKILSMNTLDALRYAEKMGLAITRCNFVNSLDYGIDPEMNCCYVKFAFLGAAYCIKIYYK